MSPKRSPSTPPLTAAALAKVVARMFPPHLAEDWDNVGLQIGDPNARVQKILTCLEATAPTLAEARRLGVDALVAHHPLIFRPMKAALASNPAQRLVMDLIRAGLNLIVAHTNMDSAPWGTNQVLAERCGLEPVGPLAPAALDPQADARMLKFVVFVPKGHPL
jgi:putative NIF3 family GTP cyclohydrolase 1 type 2